MIASASQFHITSTFNQEKALLRAFYVIVKTDGSFAALIMGAFNPIPCTCWTARGHAGRDQVTCHGVTFTFRETQRPGWRSSVEDGQIPYFYFWKL